MLKPATCLSYTDADFPMPSCVSTGIQAGRMHQVRTARLSICGSGYGVSECYFPWNDGALERILYQ